MDNINKILVVNLAFIGDVILSTPVIRALKEKYPQSSISMSFLAENGFLK